MKVTAEFFDDLDTSKPFDTFTCTMPEHSNHLDIKYRLMHTHPGFDVRVTTPTETFILDKTQRVFY